MNVHDGTLSDLRYIAWNSVDCTGEDFYDEFEKLEKKYLKEAAV